MKAYLLGAALIAVAAPAAARSPFDGTYKADVASAQLPTKPLMRSLKGDVYSCSCDTPLTIAADGKWHKVSGRPVSDEMRVTVLDNNSLQTEGRKAGKPTYTTVDKVSADGLYNNWTNTDYTPASGKPIEARGRDKRAGALPAKELHMINGGWVQTNDFQTDPAALTLTLTSVPGGMNVAIGTGEVYEAKFGGPAVPIKSDAAGTMAALRQISATSFQETLSQKGKTIAINTFTIEPDRSVSITSVNPLQKTTTKYKMVRQ